MGGGCLWWEEMVLLHEGSIRMRCCVDSRATGWQWGGGGRMAAALLGEAPIFGLSFSTMPLAICIALIMAYDTPNIIPKKINAKHWTGTPTQVLFF